MFGPKHTLRSVTADLLAGFESGSIASDGEKNNVGTVVTAQRTEVSDCDAATLETAVLESQRLWETLATIAKSWNSREANNWNVFVGVSAPGMSRLVASSHDLLGERVVGVPSNFKRIAAFLVLSQYYPVFDVRMHGRTPSEEEVAIWLPRFSLLACEYMWPRLLDSRPNSRLPLNHLKIELLTCLRNYHYHRRASQELSIDRMSESIALTALALESLYYATHSKAANKASESAFLFGRNTPRHSDDETFIVELRKSLTLGHE